MKRIDKLDKIMYVIIMLYLVILFGVFPLYYQDKYFNMGEAKYQFAKVSGIVFFGILLLLQLVKSGMELKSRLQNKQGIRSAKNLSATDWFVIAYGIAVGISFCITPYKQEAIWGYPGWYMGVLSQLLFLLIYFFVSRYARWERFLLVPVLLSSAIVFILAILHRFRIDPLGMYEGVSEKNFILFLTTIGQATWYSGYLCIVLPIGLFAFWYSKGVIAHLLLSVYIMLGFATLVTQNSDSAYIALGLMLLVLFCFSFENNEKMKRFLEIVLLGLLSFKMIGWLQLTYPDKAIPLEALSTFASQSYITVFVLMIMGLFYAALSKMDMDKTFEVSAYKSLPRVVVCIAGVGVVAVVLLVYLTTTDSLSGFLSFFKEINYFNFNENWGSGRGFTWSICTRIYQEFSWEQKLFGCGPDCFAAYSYAYYGEILKEKWGSSILTNAHNEWFTSLLFFGWSGFLSYLGIFISQIRQSVKIRKKAPQVIAVMMCIVAYMGHNFFCYQQIVCTPLIFAIIGMGEAIRRKQ